MILDVLMGTVGVVGMASGVAALVFYRKNGNGKHLPPDPTVYRDSQIAKPEPVQVQWPPELAALLTHITERLEGSLVRLESASQPKEPEWAMQMSQDMEHINDRMSEPVPPVTWPPELVPLVERLVERLDNPPPLQAPSDHQEMLLQIAERLESIVQSIPEPDPRPELSAELVRQLAELPSRVSRSLADALASERRTSAKTGQAKENNPGPPPPPRSAPPNLPRMNPAEVPGTPSIPASYVSGSVFVPAGDVWSLLYLIQKQLSPNCPGSSVEFALSSDDEVLVGGASTLGGPLSASNYGYKLTPDGPPRVYRASYPGGNTPVGELQVLAAAGGYLHVEVQS